MIKTIVIPQSNNLCVSVPNNYIGKEVEVFLYAKDELEEVKIKPKKSFASFTGVLSEIDYQSLKSHAEQARSERNRGI